MGAKALPVFLHLSTQFQVITPVQGSSFRRVQRRSDCVDASGWRLVIVLRRDSVDDLWNKDEQSSLMQFVFFFHVYFS